MNIKEAKDEIKNTMKSYFLKDTYGDYRIPIHKQRPVFMIGPPGIGKTAIMEQVAQEMGVGLVAYSMTHHTRQSALGLPYISKKNYGGKEYEVTEFTMSEIIASIYNMIEDNGVKEGILFLDEINCVSETLSPIMLQFLQYKIFGMHTVPEGWIVVTAGNPPEYNKSVREYDVVTWDRLKRIDVEPNYQVWREYAYNNAIHGSIMSYLETKKESFYIVESTINGKHFATPRGWEDLSHMIKLYEEQDISVTQKLIQQYLQHLKIAKEFAVYYDLYNKYKSDYQVENILNGTVSAKIKKRATAAKFDERLSLLGLLIDVISKDMRNIFEIEATVFSIAKILNIIRFGSISGDKSVLEFLEESILNQKLVLETGKISGALSIEDKHVIQRTLQELTLYNEILIKNEEQVATEDFALIKKEFDHLIKAFNKDSELTSERLTHLFDFIDEAFGEGQEALILVTELTMNRHCVNFISKYGNKAYFNHNKELLFYERQKEIIAEMGNLDLDLLKLETEMSNS